MYGLMVLLGWFIVFLIFFFGMRLGYKFAKWRNYQWLGKLSCSLVGFLTVFFIFYWESIPATLYFNELCENEAEYTLYGTAEGVEGFEWDIFSYDSAFKLGYSYYDEVNVDGSIERYIKSDDEKGYNIIKIINASDKSRYLAENNVSTVNYGITKDSYIIKDRKTNQYLFKKTNFILGSGTTWGGLGSFLHVWWGGRSCLPKEQQSIPKINEVLIPKKESEK